MQAMFLGLGLVIFIAGIFLGGAVGAAVACTPLNRADSR